MFRLSRWAYGGFIGPGVAQPFLLARGNQVGYWLGRWLGHDLPPLEIAWTHSGG